PATVAIMGNKNPPPDERVVFLALKNVFKGQDAEAKIRFPELFDLSPTQSAEKEASEAEAARHEADAIALAVQGCMHPFEHAAPERMGLHAEGKKYLLTLRRPHHFYTASLPIYLPFRTQHGLLVHLQKLLEGICYDFGKREIPDLLQHRGWDCVESVELNRWTDEFLKRQRKFPASKHDKKPLEQLFRSIANIRHAAVHRIPVSAKGIEKFLLDAEALATLLGDAKNTEKIAKLRRETQATELKRLESIAIAEMEREDREYQILAGKSVDDAIAPSEASFSTAIEEEKETVNRADETDDMDE
ncbi:hypothetical protein OIDMADRAFT_67125, partial [Oidiodendron maius Zn]